LDELEGYAVAWHHAIVTPSPRQWKSIVLESRQALSWLTHWSCFIAAGLEEVALWIKARGSVDTHGNITTALGALDLNAGAITTAIETLRQNHR